MFDGNLAREQYRQLRSLIFGRRSNCIENMNRKGQVTRPQLLEQFAAKWNSSLSNQGLVKIAEAVMLQQKGLFCQAIHKYQQALNLENSVGHLCSFNMGLCYQALQNGIKTQQMYRRSLSNNSHFSDGAINLFSLLIRKGLIDSAFEIALCHPSVINSISSKYNLGLIHYKRSQYSAALQIFQSVIEQAQRKNLENLKHKAQIMIGKILQKIGKTDLALICYSSVLKKVKSPALELHMRIIQMEQQSPSSSCSIKPVKPLRSISNLKSSNFFMGQFDNKSGVKHQTERKRSQSKFNLLIKQQDKNSALKSTMISIEASHFSEGISTQRISNLLSQFKEPQFKIRKPAGSFISDRARLFEVDQKSSTYSKSQKSLGGLSLNSSIHTVCKFQPALPLEFTEQILLSSLQFHKNSESVDFVQEFPLDKLVFPENTKQENNEIDQLPLSSSLVRSSSMGKCFTMQPTKLLKSIKRIQICKPLERYNEALALANDGKYKQSITYLRQILNDCCHQQKLKASSLLADIYQTLEMPDRAAIYLRRLVEDDEAMGYLKLSKLYQNMGKIDKASTLLRKGLGKHSKDSKFFQRLGWLSLNKDAIAEAIDFLEKAYSLSRQSKGVRRKLLHAYSLQSSTSKKWKSTLLELHNHTDENGDFDTETKIIIGLFLETEFSTNRRQQILKQLFVNEPDNACYLLLLGRAAAEEGNYADSFKWLKRAAEKSHSAKPLLELSQLFRLSEDYKLSRKLLRQAQNIDENDLEVISGIGAVEADQGNYRQAIRYYQKALQNEQYDFRALNKIGYCYTRLLIPEKALEYFKKSLCVNSNQPAVFREMAEVCYKFNNLEKALRYYKLARELDKQPDFQSLMGEVDCLIRCCHYKEALTFLQQIPQETGEKEVLIATAACNFYLNQYQKAISLYTRCNEIEETDEWYFNIGVCYQKQGKYKNAQTSYTSCLQINPKHTRALFNQGVIFRQLGRQKYAIDFIKRAVDIEFVENWVLLLVELYINAEKYMEALAELSRILDAESPYVREKAAYFNIKASAEVYGVDQINQLFNNFSKLYPSSVCLPQLMALHTESYKQSLVSLVISEEQQVESKIVSFKD